MRNLLEPAQSLFWPAGSWGGLWQGVVHDPMLKVQNITWGQLDVTPLPVGPGLSEAFLHCIFANRRPGWNADCLQHVQLGFSLLSKIHGNEMKWVARNKQVTKEKGSTSALLHLLVPSCNFIWQFGSSFDCRNIIYWDYIKPNFKYLNIQRGVRACYLNEHWTILAMVQMPATISGAPIGKPKRHTNH